MDFKRGCTTCLFMLFFVAVECAAEYRMEYKIDDHAYESITTDHILIQKGSSLNVRCIFENVHRYNISIVWEVTSKAWKESLWMDSTQMGLRENLTGTGTFVSEIYITKTGVKDVGSYQCINYADDELAIDPEELYVYVLGDAVTPMDTSQVMILSEEKIIPCIPSNPEIYVQLMGDGKDLTQQLKFDPRIGFTWDEAMDSNINKITSFTCHFASENSTESLQLTRGQRLGESIDELQVTLHLKENSPELGEPAELVCKVFSKPSSIPVDVIWVVPSLDPSRALHKDDPNVLITNRWRIDEIEMESIRISTLTVMEADFEDEGIYVCRAERLDGRQSQAEMHLTVDGAEYEAITVVSRPQSDLEVILRSSCRPRECLLSILITSLLIVTIFCSSFC